MQKNDLLLQDLLLLTVHSDLTTIRTTIVQNAIDIIPTKTMVCVEKE